MRRVYNRHHHDAPSDAIYCGRGTPFGNLFIIGRDGTREEVIAKFEVWLRAILRRDPHYLDVLDEHPLLCSCYPQPCHCDILDKYTLWSR